jgi:cellobiose transport system substrate-binding protein
MKRSWSTWARVGVVGLAAILLASCQSKSNEPAAPKNITLKINYWGNFGFKELKPKYEALHPNIRLALNEGDYNAQHDLLKQRLVAGSGAPDIAAIDEGFIVTFREMSDKFVNLLDKGAGEFESKYLPWKWKQSLSADGKVQIGLGTDVGGLAMCYRTDLFQAAGLPTKREDVSALWPTWDAFIETGKKYKAATGKTFVDNATNILNPVLSQQPVGYFDTSEKLQMDGGPKVAFDTAIKVVDAGLSANLPAFQPGWNDGFTSGKFAVLACPAWMQGYIQNVAPSTSGKWDIAQIPGGGGNWGGSFLTIPKQGKNIDAAWDFIKWVSQPEQQLDIMFYTGNLPSQPALYSDDAMAKPNAFFSNAPTGQIFAKTAQNLNPQYLGKKNGPVRVAVENVLTEVQNGNIKEADAWAEAVKRAEAEAAK